MMALLQALFSPWTWVMAWRDSRTSRARLFLFSTTIVLGVSALVAIGSLGRNLHEAIQEQAKGLLGADLVLQSRSAFTPAMEEFFRGLPAVEQSREVSFSSMVYFPKSQGTRLVQVRALAGGFPYYGGLETAPASARDAFRSGQGALVEESLMIQYRGAMGDPIKVGNAETRIAGTLLKIPGETVAFATVAPRVYITMDEAEKSGLLNRGSLVRYKAAFKLPAGMDAPSLVRRIRPQLEEFRLSHETVERRQEDLGRSMENLNRFLNLAGFVSLLLGAVGIASAIHVHIQQKLASAAILRCLGSTVARSFAIYLAQAIGLGAAGVLLGTVLGLAVQQAIPHLIADFLPFTVAFKIHPWPVLQAMATGLGVCILFALGPLLAVRRVSPLAVIRGGELGAAEKDPAQWAVALALAAAVIGFGISQTHKWEQGLGFAAGLGAAFGVLSMVAKGLTRAARAWTPRSWPYLLRQGLANLYRPQNRTLLLMVSLGLGTFLILTLYLVQRTLLTQLIPQHDASRPNAALFDIQMDQKDAVAEIVRAQGLQVIHLSPVISMRLKSVKDRPVEEILKDRARAIPNWVLRREYRSTYRDHLTDSENLVKGQWIGTATPGAEPFPISLDEGIARDLHVTLGDSLVFDVQGVPVKTTVASLRRVDWRRVQSNFFVVFPKGAIDDAPGFAILTTRVESSEASARLQRAVVREFPNVSAIDLTLILQTLDQVLGKISLVVRFMALFTVLTGFLVLVGAVLTGRFQRVRESVLLRTLGASRRQVLGILLAEYTLLGLMASATGVLLAALAGWVLARFVFEVSFAFVAIPLLVAVIAVTLVTVVTGLLMSLGVTRHPPLAVLRAEG